MNPDTVQSHARILDAAHDIVVTIEHGGHIVSVNPAIQSTLGWKPDQIVGEIFLDYVPDFEKERAAAEFAAVLGGATIEVDIHALTADGGMKLFSVTGAPIFDEARQVVAALAIARDVTAARADAQRLSDRERQLRLLVQSVNETVFTLDLDLRFTAVYGRWAPNAPVQASEILGKSPVDVLGRVYGDGFVEPMRRALAGERTEIDREILVGKEPRFFRLSFSPLRDDDGATVGVTGVAFDITEQRRAEKERDGLRSKLEESRRIEALGRLVSGVAHEINNPLAAILAFAEQLRSEAHSPFDVAALEAIQAQAMRSRAIVRDLIAFARPGTQKPGAVVRPGALLDNTLRTLVPHLMSLGVELITDVRADGAWIAADPPAIEQLITNLVLNAAQAAGVGGRVKVCSEATDSTFTLIVDDSGDGISPEAAPYLFEPFFTTKPVGQGTGLGLFVSLGIVKRHNGTIRAENRPAADGGGARFVVDIPRTAAPLDADTSSGGALGGDTPARGRVLLVDDEEAIRVSLRRFFTRRGWDVVDVADGRKALDLLRADGMSSFTLVLCDLRMPGMGGVELHAHLKLEFPEMLNRLVLVSGDLVSPEAASIAATTTCTLLEKPFELKTLATLADAMLAAQRVGRSASETGGASAA